MRQLDKTTLYDEELHDLKLRFELLEGDRKAYQETNEMAMKRNRDQLSSLKSHNKDLRDRMTKLKKLEADGQTARVALTEHEKFDQKICDAHKRLDELCADGRTKEEKLHQMEDALQILRTGAAQVKANWENSAQAKEIRQLENRLDKANIKQNEAQSLRKTYELIIKRLQEEKLTFDHQLHNLEDTLKQRMHDAAELEVLSRDAHMAKEMCKNELNRVESQLNHDRKSREKILTARKELVKQRLQELQEKMDRKDINLDEPADANHAGDAARVQENEDADRRLMELEENLGLIKETMGVNSLKESVNKITSLGDTRSRLEKLRTEQDQLMASLKARRIAVLAELEDLKYTGESKSIHSKNMVDELKQRNVVASQRLQEVRGKCERTTRVLTNARSGIECLFEKLNTIQVAAEKDAKRMQVLNVADESVARLLDACVAKLDLLANNVQGHEQLIEQQAQAANAAGPSEGQGSYGVTLGMLPQFNTRIKIRSDGQDFGDDEDENEDEGAEMLDRDTIKKHSQQLLNARNKSKQAKKTKKKSSGKDSDDE